MSPAHPDMATLRWSAIVIALSVGFSTMAEPPITLDCTIGYWNSKWVKEMEHDYQKGYSATKVPPENIAWLRPGKIGPGNSGRGFFVLGRCQKGNLTPNTDLRKLTIKLSKLASDHGANAINHEISGTELRVQFLRIPDPTLDALKRGDKTKLNPNIWNTR
jgi:hypothetical protein